MDLHFPPRNGVPVLLFQSHIRGAIVLVACMSVSLHPAIAPAQQRVVAGPDGKRTVVGQRGATPSPAVADQRKPPSSKPEEKSKEGDKKEEEKKGAESPEPKVIRRDEVVRGDANPDELKAMIGEDGKVAFQFRNQPWVELVQWLADISNKPLDWLELPGDRVNMRSPGRYTVEETRDLFNRYLLARGFTLLEIDGGLTVAKTEKINPAIVPRVNVAELAKLQPHTFVRTSLDVGWLSAEKLSEELAPMISGNGRLTALTTTNRIEAMDAAVNLRQIAQLLEQERDQASLEALAPEFKLRYLPAEEAKQMLEEFLGVEKKQSTPMTPQQMAMLQQQMRSQGNRAAVPQPKKIEISVVANVRQNSVIIRAPADRTAVALQFLKRVDVPSDAMISLADIRTRVQVFRLASLDPEKLIEIVSEMNILEPTTRVSVDKENNALIVSGSAADRFVVDSLIKRLDGSGRSFEVLPLRRLDPVEVAESIAFLMGQKDEEDEQQSSRRYYYGYYGRQEEEKKKPDEFRVAANTRYRQVLLWANEQEMEEVRSLLIKLGELPPPGGSSRTTRVIDASATPETYEYLQRLKQQWDRLSPNPLVLPDQKLFKEPNLIPGNKDGNPPDEKSGDDKDDADDVDQPKQKNKGVVEDSLVDRNAGVSAGPQYQLTLMQSGTAEADDSVEREQDSVGNPGIRSARDFDRLFGRPATEPETAAGSTRSPASIRIEIDASGNIVLSSPDTEALDRIENLMLQVTPPKRPYHVFHIEHATAYWMRLNLEDYYADLEEDAESDQFMRWYWGFDRGGSEDSPSGLGKGAKLRFVDDPDTNTLVVSGATNEQLRTISELIELWDVPEPVNKRKTRFTRLVSISFGRAEKIAETVKEAYRDLLSSNDKAFAGGRGRNQQGGGEKSEASKSRNGNGSGLQSSDGAQDGGGADFSFKGKLSLGIDNVGNTLLVSAEGEPLLDLVTDMIQQLDEAARPRGEVQVFSLPGGISGDTLQNALRPIGIDASISTRPGSAPSPPANSRGEAKRE